MPYPPSTGLSFSTSSRFRSLPEARRTDKHPLSSSTATPAESYPRYSSRLRPSIMMGTALCGPMYPTIPHIISRLVQELHAIILNDRVGQHLAGDLIHFPPGLLWNRVRRDV